MSERFTEILRAASEPAWSDAVRHRFVNELFAGAVPDAVMARYLIQDHRFLDSFLRPCQDNRMARMYLWRAVNHEGEVLDMLVQSRRDSPAALRLMRKLLRKQ